MANADEVPRSVAKDRRLRQRRQEARLRLRLAADAVLLAGHHASSPPQQASPELAALRAEVAALRALVHKLVASAAPAEKAREQDKCKQVPQQAEADKVELPQGDVAEESAAPSPTRESDKGTRFVPPQPPRMLGPEELEDLDGGDMDLEIEERRKYLQEMEAARAERKLAKPQAVPVGSRQSPAAPPAKKPGKGRRT